MGLPQLRGGGTPPGCGEKRAQEGRIGAVQAEPGPALPSPAARDGRDKGRRTVDEERLLVGAEAEVHVGGANRRENAALAGANGRPIEMRLRECLGQGERMGQGVVARHRHLPRYRIRSAVPRGGNSPSNHAARFAFPKPAAG